MSPFTKSVVVAAVPLLVLGTVGALMARSMELTGALVWAVPVGFLVLGLISGGTLFWFLRRNDASADRPDDHGVDLHIDPVIGAARRRMASARGGRTAFARLPIVLLMGPGGSTKTTSMIRSGLDPELLAGEVRKGDTTVPTPGVNVWLSQGALWVEAGGSVLEDDTRWRRFVDLLHPGRFGAVFRGEGQAPRSVVLCVSCEDLLGADAPERLHTLAATLRARLVETARDFGVPLPVYVLFTKVDRIRYFEDFVRHFTHEEARRALGATIPFSEPPDLGSYAESQHARVGRAFDRLFHSLARKRLKYLPRDADVDRVTRAYEFPRELNKLRELILRFLVELCRPSELEISPFLRGFYFTGVRPIVVQQGGVAPAPATGPALAGSVDATMVFDALAVRRAAQVEPPPSGSTRRVPQWVFLERVLRDVVLRDRVARLIAGGGTHVTAWRRRLLAAAAAVALLFAAGQTVSWMNNRTLAAEVSASVAGVAGLEVDIPEGLAQLDSLRTRVVQLGDWERRGPPLTYGLGLYSGSSIYTSARAAYFEAFDRLLFEQTVDRLEQSLGSLPAEPSESDDYGRAYDDLRAYLIATTYPQRGDSTFLGPLLMNRWQGGRPLEPERDSLVRRQFAFYASELPRDDPYANLAAEPDLVDGARSFLLKFGETEPFLRALVADARGSGEPVRITGTVMVDSVTIEGAFTREGWEHVQRRISDPDSLLMVEDWVFGEIAPPRPATLAQALDSLYQRQFAARWLSFIRSASIVPFVDDSSAGSQLTQLGDPLSPLSDLLLSTAEHTAAASESVKRRFGPVYALAPVDSAGNVRLSEPTRQYMSTLSALGAAMTSLAAMSPEEKAPAVQAARTQIVTAKQRVVDVAQGFTDRSPESRILAADLRQLLDQPLEMADQVLAGVEGRLADLPVRELNERAGLFCRDFERLNAFFPFRADPAARDAPLDEVAAALQPGSSALWNLYSQSLQGILERRGNQYVPRPDASVEVLPAFLSFFNRAASVSGTLYSVGAERPALDVSFRPRFEGRLEALTVSVDGSGTQFTPLSNQTLVLPWNGQPEEIRLVGRVDGVERTLFGPVSGSWALFRFLLAAERWTSEGSRYRAEWSIPIPGAADLKLVADVEAPAALATGAFGELRCPGRIAR